MLDRDTIRKIQKLIVFTLLILVGLWRFDVVVDAARFILHILSPFLLGGAIAFILNVPMCRIQKRLFGRAAQGSKMERAAAPVSLLVTILAVTGILGLVVVVVLPELASTVAALSLKIPEMFERLETHFTENPEIFRWFEELQLNWDEILAQIVDFFYVGVNTMFGSTISAAKGIVSAVTTFFIAFVFACYILLQKETLGRQMRKLFFAYLKKERAESVLRVCGLTSRTFANFLTGQCLEAVILGAMFFVSMTILRFPYALLVGVLVAFTALIPIFGAFIGCAVGAFLILTVNPVQAAGFIALFLVLQQVEGNLIYPHVVGGSVGLPSIWVLAAVSLGGSLMGIVGMLVFIPIVSVLYTLLRENVHARLEEKDLHIE